MDEKLKLARAISDLYRVRSFSEVTEIRNVCNSVQTLEVATGACRPLLYWLQVLLPFYDIGCWRSKIVKAMTGGLLLHTYS